MSLRWKRVTGEEEEGADLRRELLDALRRHKQPIPAGMEVSNG